LALDATSTVALMICVILSFYGRPYEDELLTAKFSNQIKPHLNEICWRDLADKKKKRLVDDKDGKWFVELRG
jgi:hypothetical protein